MRRSIRILAAIGIATALGIGGRPAVLASADLPEAPSQPSPTSSPVGKTQESGLNDYIPYLDDPALLDELGEQQGMRNQELVDSVAEQIHRRGGELVTSLVVNIVDVRVHVWWHPEVPVWAEERGAFGPDVEVVNRVADYSRASLLASAVQLVRLMQVEGPGDTWGAEAAEAWVDITGSGVVLSVRDEILAAARVKLANWRGPIPATAVTLQGGFEGFDLSLSGTGYAYSPDPRTLEQTSP